MTIRIAIAGIRGRMGREIAPLAVADPNFVLVGGTGREPGEIAVAGLGALPVVADPSALLAETNVVIDFSAPAVAVAQAVACAAAGVPFVCGTTGLDTGQDAALREAAARTAVFRAANMSPGLNALLAALPALVRALEGYDVEIVETHHRYKADAPSGTALALARAIAAAGGDELDSRAVYGREGASLRQGGEIGIHAVRSGGNSGEHEIILASDGEEVRLSHRAFSRAAYAQGALRAARLLAGQPPGWYEPATLPGFL